MADAALAAPEAADGQPASGEGRLAIILAWVFGGLALVALAVWGYLVLARRKTVARDHANAQQIVVRTKTRSERLAAEIDRIARDKLEKVNVLSEVVLKLTSPNIRVQVGRPVASRWRSTNYDEVRCQVTFQDKEGYEFLGLMSYIQSIEKANPKIQIKSLNLGPRLPRREGENKDYWQPIEAVVRAFVPRTT
jgi:hypothetical protein